MERELHERERVGVHDFVLLENFQSEAAFIDNLRKRFRENIIYVSHYYSSAVNPSKKKWVSAITDIYWTSAGLY